MRLLFRRIRSKDSSVFSYTLVQTAQDRSGDVTTFDSFLVEIIVNRRRRSAEHRADIDVHDGAITVIAREINTELTPEIVGGTHDGP